MNHRSLSIRPGRRNLRRAGYNLIEVLVGTALLAVIGLTIAGLFSKGRREIDSAGNLTTALSIAQHVSEDLDSLPYEMFPVSFSPSLPTSEDSVAIRIRKSGTNWVISSYPWIKNPLPGPPGSQARFADTNPDNDFDFMINAGGIYDGPDVLGSGADPTAEPIKSWITKWTGELAGLPEAQMEIVMTCMFDVDDDPATYPTPNDQTLNYPADFDAAAMIRIDVTVKWTEGSRRRMVSVPQARTYNEV